MTHFVSPGLHLLIDCWGARHLRDPVAIEAAFRKAVSNSGATLLDIQLHTFGEGAGVTGVAILAESHMSIHTWPEIDYLAMDIFMCGSCDPYAALATLQEIFQPERTEVREHRRGIPSYNIATNTKEMAEEA